MKTFNIYEVALKKLDSVDLAQTFKEMCANGNVDSDVIFRFMQHVMPLYEASKKELLAELYTVGARELIDWIWEDPLDPTPYSRLHALKEIAKEFSIATNEQDGRTNKH